MKPKSSRRDFLKGKSASRAASGEISRSRGQGPAADSRLIHVSRKAMACEFEITFNAGQYPRDAELALETLDLVDILEDRMSVFRHESEISRINRTAADEPVEVEPGLFGLLELALQLHDETDGAFDVTSTPLWEVWGFDRRAGAVPDEAELAEARSRVGSHLVRLDPDRHTVRFLKEGVQLNLGSLGKGYALDRCSQKLMEAGVDDFLIHGGGSSVTAHGSRATAQGKLPAEPHRGWTVGVVHPLRGTRRLAEVRLRDRALATSGSRAQSFVYKGQRFGHILDPRTGWPAEGLLSATVVAPSAALADGLATAFYVLGPQRSLEYCRSRPEIAAVLVCPVRHSGGLELKTVGFADDEPISTIEPSAAGRPALRRLP